MGDPNLSTALLRAVEARLKKRGDEAADRIRERVSELDLTGKQLKWPKKIDESTGREVQRLMAERDEPGNGSED